MDLAIGEDENYHVLVQILGLALYLVALLDCWLQNHVEVGWPSELQVWYRLAISVHYALHHEHMGVLFVSVHWETVVHFVVRVEGWHIDFRTETINRNQFVIIII